MTEDDTFNALKKWTFQQAVDFYYKTCVPIGESQILIDTTGWTYQGLIDACTTGELTPSVES